MSGNMFLSAAKGLFRCDHKDANDCLYLYTYERLSNDPKILDYNLFIEKSKEEIPIKRNFMFCVKKAIL